MEMYHLYAYTYLCSLYACTCEQLLKATVSCNCWFTF